MTRIRRSTRSAGPGAGIPRLPGHVSTARGTTRAGDRAAHRAPLRTGNRRRGPGCPGTTSARHLPVDAQRDHRPRFIDQTSMQGAVRVLSCPTHSSRDAHIAEQIRSAHVHDRLGWQDMAVLVRSADDLAGVERALSVAGVPASITADELPLHEEPAVAVLLTLIEIAARPRIATPEGSRIYCSARSVVWMSPIFDDWAGAARPASRRGRAGAAGARARRGPCARS